MTKNYLYSKNLVLAVLDILKENSSINHPISNKRILEILKSEYELAPHRDTVGSALTKIRDHYGDDVIVCKHSEQRAYTHSHYYNHPISDRDIHIIINTIIFSKFLPIDKVKDLTQKMQTLATNEYQKKLNHLFMNPNKQYKYDSITYENIELIQQALYENKNDKVTREKRVVFNFNGYGTDKKLHKTREKDYVVYPVEISETNQKHYLICYIEGSNKFYHFRIDLMTNVRIEDFTGLKKDQEKQYHLDKLKTKTLEKYMHEHPYMFYDNDVRIELEVLKDKGEASMTCLVDTFGTNWNVIKEDTDKVKVSVRCTVEAMKIWVMQYIEKVKVVGPEDVKQKIDGSIIESLEKYLGNR